MSGRFIVSAAGQPFRTDRPPIPDARLQVVDPDDEAIFERVDRDRDGAIEAFIRWLAADLIRAPVDACLGPWSHDSEPQTHEHGPTAYLWEVWRLVAILALTAARHPPRRGFRRGRWCWPMRVPMQPGEPIHREWLDLSARIRGGPWV